ncbi:hypothetical protein OHS58_05765 [Amycolatopsis sp. NBC_00348]|uniref:hypothetical protein n=1 Tax=Amycolatopsis sp. NBC_00348 TaxID=2975956 RepID=UPI002E25DE66
MGGVDRSGAVASAGGARAAGGLTFQAEVFAWWAAHAVANYEPGLGLDSSTRIEAVGCETGFPVDDVGIAVSGGGFILVQAKGGLRRLDSRAEDLRNALDQLVKAMTSGLRTPSGVRPVDPSRDRLMIATNQRGSGAFGALGTVCARLRDHPQPLPLDDAAKTVEERQAFTTFRHVIESAWAATTGSAPTENELRQLLRVLVVQRLDFDADAGVHRVRGQSLLERAQAARSFSHLVGIGLEVARERSWRQRQALAAALGVPADAGKSRAVDAWQHAVRKGRGRRVARLTPLVNPARRDAVLAWMTALDDPIVDVPAGTVRVLVARLGAGKSEQAARWWEQGLQAAANDPDIDIPLYFEPRHIATSLEQAVVAELGGEPTNCRVVLDDLDSLPAHEADHLLAEARELVQVWPNVSVLATARPGIAVPAEEKIDIAPWPVGRGADLAEVAIGDHIPPHLWTTETADLLTSPLTALALAARIDTGRDTNVSRAQLLSGLAPMVIQSHHLDVSDETWQDLARLAVALLEQPQTATAALFEPLPRLRRLVATDLVVMDNRTLAFALPVLEQYFGAEAIRSELVSLEAVAAAGSFPRWRYALAFAISSAAAPEQEALLIKLARINPAAAFWVLDEIAETEAPETLDGPSDEVIAALIRRRDASGAATDPDLAIRAGVWLREAEQALLTGLGPLAESLVRHRDGKLVQWGVWLQSGYLTLARARDAVPPPAVVKLAEIHPSLAHWHRWKEIQLPTTDFGRWLLAQEELQEQLQAAIRRRTLPVPRTSWLARERTYFLASFVQDSVSLRPRRPIHLAELRDTVADRMETVNTSVRATWQGPGGPLDSDDIRWLSAQLTLEDGDTLQPPWPAGDQPHTGRWAWQEYSPELTLTMATAIVREALVGYRQLVELNFPAFGNAMGLYSMLPLRVEGLVGRFADDSAISVEMLLMLHPDPKQHDPDTPAVDLRIVTDDHDRTFWDFGQNYRRSPRTTFGQHPLQDVQLPLHVTSPATSLAYRWLAEDLAAIGWLKNSHRFVD